MSSKSGITRTPTKYSRKRETRSNVPPTTMRRSYVSGTTGSLYKSVADLADEVMFFSHKEEEEVAMYIEWGKLKNVDDLQRLSNVWYNEELKKLDTSPLPFHSNLGAKRAFLPDAVQEHLFYEHSQNRSQSYSSRFSDIFESNSGELAPVVKEGLGVVLFIDISGFTKLGAKYYKEHRDAPKLAADKLSADIIQVIHKLTKICYENKGSVAKFAGDALICVWECDLNAYKESKMFSKQVTFEKIVNEVCAMIDNFVKLAKKSCAEMVKAAAEENDLKLHGGIGVGNITHLFLGKSKRDGKGNYNPDGLMWYVINGYAIECATRLMQIVKKKIVYLKSYRQWIEAFILQSFFYDFDSAINAHNFDLDGHDIKKHSQIFEELLDLDNIGILDVSSTYTVDLRRHIPWAATSNNNLRVKGKALKTEKTFDDFLPRLLKMKLQGNSVLGNEILDGVSIVFIKLDDVLIKSTSFLSLPVKYDPSLAVYSLDKCFRDSLNYLNRTFIALSNSVKKAGGEVRDLIFDDKGCVFICAFSAHRFVSHSEFRAVAAAIDIVKAHEKAKIGITSGSCFVGLCGTSARHDFIMMGADVNFAAGMMVQAPHGKILVSEAVYQKLKNKLTFKEVIHKGKAGETICYSVSDIPEVGVLHDLPRNFFPVLFDRNNFKKLLREAIKRNEAWKAHMEKLLNLSKFSPFVNQNESVARARRSISMGNHVFIHGRLGYGKNTFVDTLKRRLVNDKVYKVFSVCCSDLETNKHFSTIRKLLKIILDSELHSKKSTDPMTKFSRKLRTEELGEVFSVLGSKGNIAKEDILRVIQYLLPHLKFSQVQSLVNRSPSRHLDSLQSLLTVEPDKGIAEECQAFFCEFIRILASGLLKPSKADKERVKTNTRKSSRKSKQLNSILLVDPKVKRKPRVNTISKPANKVKSIQSSKDEERFQYILIFEDFEQINNLCWTTLLKVLEDLPPNVQFVFTMDRIPRIPVRSGNIQSHQAYLKNHLKFREHLNNTEQGVDDIYLERLSIEVGISCAKRFCFSLFFSHFDELREAFLADYLSHEYEEIYSTDFIEDSLSFYFKAIGEDLDEGVLEAISRNSRGHPGRIACLTKSYFENELLGKKQSKDHLAPPVTQIPRPIVGDLRTMLDTLPGVCVWVLKVLSVIGPSLPFIAAHRVCNALFIEDSPLPPRSKSKNKKKSSFNMGDDFQSLFTHTVSMLLNYKMLVEDKDLQAQRLSHTENKSQASRHSGTAKYKKQGTRTASRIGSLTRHSSFDIQKTKVSSMFFSTSKLAFPTATELQFFQSLVPYKRKLKILKVAEKHLKE